MQNIQERLTGLWPATGASSRRTARFAVSISESLEAGLTTSVDMGFRTSKRIFKKNHGFSARCPAFFFQKLNMSDSHHLLKHIFGICLCSMLISLSKVSNLLQNGLFPIFSLFWQPFLLP